MYDFSDVNTFSKLKFDLLPLTKFENIYSVFIVGNKFDLLDTNNKKFVLESDKADISNMITLDNNRFNLKYYNVSCKEYYNVTAFFSDVLTALVNPNHLLFEDADNNFVEASKNIGGSMGVGALGIGMTLTNGINNNFVHSSTNLIERSSLNFKKEFEMALIRIFRIFDQDNKKIISKKEFMKIHKQVFNISLEDDHFEALMELLKLIQEEEREKEKEKEEFRGLNSENVNNGYLRESFEDGVKDLNGITLENFILLNKTSIKMNQSKTPWTILRRFGYNDNLEIDSNYLEKEKGLILTKKSNEEINLTEKGINLLKKKFNLFSNDDQFLNEIQWNNLFICVPKKIFNSNFKEIKENFKLNNTEDKISMNEWVKLWHILTKMNHVNAFKIFTYLGFDFAFKEIFEINSKMTTENIQILSKEKNEGKQKILNVLYIYHNDFETVLMNYANKNNIVYKDNLIILVI